MINPTYYPQQPNYIQQQTMQQTTQQSNVLVCVQSEQEYLMYPVAPGTTVMFLNVKEPYFYTKTVSLTQMDKPICKKFRLVEEKDEQQTTEYVTMAAFNELLAKVESLTNDRKPYNNKRKEDRNNEQHS